MEIASASLEKMETASIMGYLKDGGSKDKHNSPVLKDLESIQGRSCQQSNSAERLRGRER